MSAPADPPAFPRHVDAAGGMSLRDYFAARAMQAWVTAGAFNQNAENMLKKAGINPGKSVEIFIARCAYEMADAMLAAREEAIAEARNQ